MVFQEKGPARCLSDDGNHILKLIDEGQLTHRQAWWWLEEADRQILTDEVARLVNAYPDPEERLAVFWEIHRSQRYGKKR